MGTRGFIGFAVDGQEKITYCYNDSYPEGLGADMLAWLRDAVIDMDALRASVRNLRVIAEGQRPTPEDVQQLAPYTNLNVSSRSTDDWYCLLRETQGNPELILAAGIIEDATGFPSDSLFAEWGYVVDLDAGTFEVYQGFQKTPHQQGRFASGETPPAPSPSPLSNTYYPVALVASWPLGALPDDQQLRDLERHDD